MLYIVGLRGRYISTIVGYTGRTIYTNDDNIYIYVYIYMYVYTTHQIHMIDIYIYIYVHIII